MSWFAPLVAGVVALLAGVALPLAPVLQSDVRVAWPADGRDVQNTTLLLTNQTPHTLDVAFTGEAGAKAAQSGGTILATIRPDSPDAATSGLLITSRAGQVRFETSGESWSWPFAATDQWELRSSVHGLEISRNGAVVESAQDVLPPQIDALITDAEGVTADVLSARLQLVDDANSQPGIAKITLMAILLLALVILTATIRRDDRRRLGQSGAPSAASNGAVAALRHALARGLRSLTPADAVLAGALTLWIFIGPMTDDDGYYSVMAYNATEAGYVGNYFQMFNQTFTPFTWIWQFFDVWQHLGGRSPVWLRVPSLAFALVAWFVSRSILNRFLRTTRWRTAEAARILLAVITFTWWASYTIGARPEPFAAMATILVVALLSRAHATRRLTPAAVAVGLAAASFATHPIGVVSAAPVILSIPMLWSIAREGSSVTAAIARTVAVAGASAVALFAAFGDGSLNDMLTGQRRFALVEAPLSWADEFRRYGLLFADIPMGSFARRSVVLVALVLLVWYLVFVLWSRRVGAYSSPIPLSLVGWSFALSFVLMWITTSKWTHHFGSLASIGPLFIVLMCVAVPKLVRRQLGEGGRLAPWLAPLAIVSLVPAMIYSLRGPDWWPYEIGEGPGIVHRDRPEVFGVTLANYFVWALIVVVIVVATLLLAQRRGGSWKAPSALFGVLAIVSVFFGMTGAYLLGTFARLASPLHEGFTVGQANLADPTGASCLPDQAVRIWDAAKGVPLAAASGTTSASGFVRLEDSDLMLPAAARVEGWTSATGADGIGELRSPWYSVPSLDSDERVGVLVFGDFMSQTRGILHAELRSEGATVDVPLVNSAQRVGWTTLLIDIPDDLAGSTELEVRVVAQDVSALPGASVAVTAPAAISGTTLRDLSTSGEPTAIGWTQTFWFPCERPMTIARGIIEPPVLATTWGTNGIDNVWVTSRGGSLAGVQRLALVNTPATGMGETADPSWGRVHLFEYPASADAYELTQSWVTTPGWRSAFDPASQLVAASEG